MCTSAPGTSLTPPAPSTASCGPIPNARAQSRQITLEIADIFRRHEQEYRAQHAVGKRQSRVINAVVACRTQALGGRVLSCDTCGAITPVYNSCRDRHCPKCQLAKQTVWLAQRQQTILPTHYFHVVMTLPDELRELVRHNARLLLGLLMRTAAETLTTLGRDPKRLGAQLAVTAVLHTWTKSLLYHPHVHCIVSGGGLSLDGTQWNASRPSFLFPAEVIRRLYRGRFLAALRELFNKRQLVLPGTLEPLRDPGQFKRLVRKLYKKKWVVYAKQPFGGPEQVFAYLGRYTHRVGITSARLLHVSESSVAFRTRRRDSVTVPPLEFMRRFLLHVLPRGFVKIRHYGLVAGRHVKGALQQAKALAQAASPTRNETPHNATASLTETTTTYPAPIAVLEAANWQERLWVLTRIDVTLCQHCGARTLTVLPLANADTS